MINKKKLMNIIVALKTTAASCEHQALCIEAEDTNEEAKTSSGTIVKGINDMWDCNDSDNWTSMEANINDAVSFLEKLL